jgi:fibronectin type 3 domain-containing protein
VDGVAITQFHDVELRVTGEKSTQIYPVPPPASSDKEDPQPKPVAFSIDSAAWTGQHIAVSVRTSVKKTDHFSGWSDEALLKVVAPLEKPVVQAAPSADGVVLTWVAADGAQYQIERQGPNDKQPVNLATVNEGRYVDVSSQFDTPYTYTVRAKDGAAESLPSEPVTISAVDKYAPAVPSGVTIVAGPTSVDLSWQRNAEPDFQGYLISRSTDNGPYERQGDMTALPTYVDHNVEHGKTYSYKISAVDKKGNESAPSKPVEAQF